MQKLTGWQQNENARQERERFKFTVERSAKEWPAAGLLSRMHSEGVTTKHTKDTKTRAIPLADLLNK